MMRLLMGTHAEVREFLVDYLEGALPALKRAQFRLHLLLCRRCADYLRRYDTGVALARGYLDDPPPDELVELTLRFLEQRQDAEQPEGDPRPQS